MLFLTKVKLKGSAELVDVLRDGWMDNIKNWEGGMGAARVNADERS